jgi:signal transduction histidine kinase
MKQMHRRRTRRTRSSQKVDKFVRELETIHTHASISRVEAKRPDAQAIPPDEGDLERYQQLYELAPIGFYTLDRQARITELNEQGAKLLGFPATWLLGKSFVVFIARQDTQRFLKFLRESVQSHSEPHSIELDLWVSSCAQSVQLSLTTSGEGSSLRHQITVVNLTGFRKTEKLLHDSLANWYSLVHNAPDTILTVEARGRIAFVNRPIWGYSVKALVGTNILDYVPESDQPKLARSLEQSFRYNRRTMCELTGLGGDWSRWYNFSFGCPHPSRLTGPGAPPTPPTPPTTTTLMIREISEHKRTEETLRLSGEQMRDLSARLEAVREEERTRVAREIHDELGQALTVLKLDLSWVQSKTRGAAEIRKKMKSMIAHVDDTIERMRRISSELRPAILDDLGLIPAIEWQISEFRKHTRIRTEITSNADGLSLPMEASAAVFRVVQEALTNVMRHAEATRLRISLNLNGHALKISIEDNGRGIKRSEETHVKSLGIVGMKERIFRLGGEFNIFSEPGKGTRLDLIIPVQHD